MKFWPALLPLTLVLLAGCRRAQPPQPAAAGGTATSIATVGAASPVPTTPNGSALDPGVVTILRRFALTQADVPQGYSIGGQLELPNEQVARDYADPQAALQEIQDTGRQGGIAEQIFAPSAGAGGIGVSIELFRDVSGAEKWVANPPDFPPNLNATPADLTQPIGEQASAFHWTQGSQSGYVLNFRRGRVVYGLGISASTGSESLDPVVALAQRLDEKAKKQST